MRSTSAGAPARMAAGQLPQPGGVGRRLLASGGGPFQQERTLDRFRVEIGDAGLKLLVELVLPTGKRVLPGLNGKLVRPDAGEAARSPPTVVLDKDHRGFPPRILCSDRTPFQHRRRDVVSVLEDVGFHRQFLSDHPFERQNHPSPRQG